jgi:signal transduction histidine kinase
MVERGFAALGAHLGVVALLSADETTLEIVNQHGVSASTLQQYQTFPVSAPLPLSDAVRSRQPIWARTFAEIEQRYPQFADRSRAANTRAFTCLPLLVEDRVIGGVNMSFPRPQAFDEEEQRLMVALADQCAQALERARLYRAEEEALADSERARERLAFLANVSVVLSSSLDYETTLANVAKLAVPEISDWCRVDMVDEQGAVQLVAIAHVDPAKVAWIYSLQDRYPPNPEANGGVHEVIRTGKPAYYPDLPDNGLATAARDEEQLSIMREIGYKSIIIAPLTLRDTCLGAVTLVTTAESGRLFTPDDVAFTQEIARRGAVAIENARLFAQARRTAVEEERQRLARELHDAVSQALFSANVMGEALPRLWQRNPEKAFEKLGEVTQLTRGAAAELRILLLELRPEMLDKNRLTDLIAQLVEATKSRRKITITCTFDGDYQPPTELHTALFRITQEALNNVVKHSQASRGEVVLRSAPSAIELKIIDNGRGFVPDDTVAGFGILSMRERAQAVKATLELVSEIGKGTEVRVMWQPQATE